MNLIDQIKDNITSKVVSLFNTDKKFEITLNADKDSNFGDLSSNAAMVLSKEVGKPPRAVAQQIIDSVNSEHVDKMEIAGPGFINIYLTSTAWQKITSEIFNKKFFTQDKNKQKYLLEFVSANPTGPLHLGHGRGGIIGDVLSRVLKFLGHDVQTEFYINDAGNQINNLGRSLKARCNNLPIPEGGYHGEYLVKLAEEIDNPNQDDEFFANYAKEKMLERQKQTLMEYGIKFDGWFSEKTLHDGGLVNKVIKELADKDLVYENDGALWFRSTQFGDDKDRVIQKQDGSLTYIAADIAYHKDKFDRGYDQIIDILGQDHHGYVKRLIATMAGLGYDQDKLNVILYQLVSIKIGDATVKMSKRAGTFTTLKEVIDTVGCDVARFFYLNRKADAHLDFDLDVALKKSEENPAYYVQYAYVRTSSILKKADKISYSEDDLDKITDNEIKVIKKIASLNNLLKTIAGTYQTHLLSYYTVELAKVFHNYYAHNRIIDENNLEATKMRLALVAITKQSLAMCFDLLGISKPESM